MGNFYIVGKLEEIPKRGKIFNQISFFKKEIFRNFDAAKRCIKLNPSMNTIWRTEDGGNIWSVYYTKSHKLDPWSKRCQ